MPKTLNKLTVILYILATLFAQLYSVSATANAHNQAMQTCAYQSTVNNMMMQCDLSIGQDCSSAMNAEVCNYCDIDCTSVQCSAAYLMTSLDLCVPYSALLSASYTSTMPLQTISLLFRPPIAL